MTVTHTSKAMSIIEEIKRDIGHDEGCASLTPAKGWGLKTRPVPQDIRPCNCSRRRKIAWLERMEEPTERMVEAGGDEIDRLGGAYTHDEEATFAFRAMLKAAEEDLP